MGDYRAQIFWLIVLVVALGIIGLVVILGITRSWRNYNERQRLIDQGKRMRIEAPGKRPTTGYIDTWSVAGARLDEGPSGQRPEDLEDDPERWRRGGDDLLDEADEADEFEDEDEDDDEAFEDEEQDDDEEEDEPPYPRN